MSVCLYEGVEVLMGNSGCWRFPGKGRDIRQWALVLFFIIRSVAGVSSRTLVHTSSSFPFLRPNLPPPHIPSSPQPDKIRLPALLPRTLRLDPIHPLKQPLHPHFKRLVLSPLVKLAKEMPAGYEAVAAEEEGGGAEVLFPSISERRASAR